MRVAAGQSLGTAVRAHSRRLGNRGGPPLPAQVRRGSGVVEGGVGSGAGKGTGWGLSPGGGIHTFVSGGTLDPLSSHCLATNPKKERGAK